MIEAQACNVLERRQCIVEDSDPASVGSSIEALDTHTARRMTLPAYPTLPRTVVQHSGVCSAHSAFATALNAACAYIAIRLRLSKKIHIENATLSLFMRFFNCLSENENLFFLIKLPNSLISFDEKQFSIIEKPCSFKLFL